MHTENATDLTKPTAAKGTLVKQSAQPTAAGNQQTVLETITPKDQMAKSWDVSLAAETEREVHTENATDLTKPTAAKGTIVKQSAQPTPAGNQQTVVDTITPKDQVVKSYGGDAFESVEVEEHTENATDLTKPTDEVGKIKEATNAPTEAGNSRTKSKVRLAIARTTNFVSAVTNDGTEITEVGHNADALPDLNELGLEDGEEAVLRRGDINGFQKYDYLLEVFSPDQAPKNFGAAEGAGVYWTTYGRKYWVYHRGHYNPSSGGTIDYIDAQHLYRERWHSGIKYFATAVQAAAALPALAVAAGGEGAVPMAGSGVVPAGKLWQAHVVTRVDEWLLTKNWTLTVNPDGSWYTS